MAFGHVILREFHLDRQAEYFEDYCRKYTDMPMLVRLEEKDGKLVPGRFLRADDFSDKLGEKNNPEWKTVAFDEMSGKLVAPNGSIGYRWGEQGEWNLEETRRRPPTRAEDVAGAGGQTTTTSSASTSPISAARQSGIQDRCRPRPRC